MIRRPDAPWTRCVRGARSLGPAGAGLYVRRLLLTRIAIGEEPLEQLNLTRVVEVVSGDAGEQREVADLARGRHLREIARGELHDLFTQRPMSRIEEREIGPPLLFSTTVTREEIRALEWE